MAVNLPPQYHDAEARYKKGRTPEEKLAALKEMWVILPKHKASEKVQASLKTKISELTDQIEHEKSAPQNRPPAAMSKTGQRRSILRSALSLSSRSVSDLILVSIRRQ